MHWFGWQVVWTDDWLRGWGVGWAIGLPVEWAGGNKIFKPLFGHLHRTSVFSDDYSFHKSTI